MTAVFTPVSTRIRLLLRKINAVFFSLSVPQEREFLKNYVQRIVDVRPTLVLVERTVSRIAQDMLLEHGITLVINVKAVSQVVL